MVGILAMVAAGLAGLGFATLLPLGRWWSVAGIALSIVGGVVAMFAAALLSFSAGEVSASNAFGWSAIAMVICPAAFLYFRRERMAVDNRNIKRNNSNGRP